MGSFFAQDVAVKLGLTGFVRNEPDGSVYIEVKGEEVDLHEFLAWSRKGPPFAKVKKVESSFFEATGNDKEFGIE